jgi:hypothetical protein
VLPRLVAHRFNSPGREQLTAERVKMLRQRLAAMPEHELAMFYRVTGHARRLSLRSETTVSSDNSGTVPSVEAVQEGRRVDDTELHLFFSLSISLQHSVHPQIMGRVTASDSRG